MNIFSKLSKLMSSHVIVSDDMQTIKAVPKEDFKSSDVDFVLCLEDTPDNQPHRSEGSVNVQCHDCKVTVMRSPSSPTDRPCICLKCARERMKDEHTVQE